MVKPLHATPRKEPADAFVIAVPTPFNAVDRSPNLDHVDPAADGISRDPRFGKCVDFVDGATERLAGRLTCRRPDLSFPPARHDEPLDVHVAHCLERVLPIRLVREVIENDRIIGGAAQVRERTERSKRMVCSCLGLTYKPDVDDLRQPSTS